MRELGVVDLETHRLLDLFGEVAQPSPFGDLVVPMLLPELGPLLQPLGLTRRLKLVARVRAQVLAGAEGRR